MQGGPQLQQQELNAFPAWHEPILTPSSTLIPSPREHTNFERRFQELRVNLQLPPQFTQEVVACSIRLVSLSIARRSRCGFYLHLKHLCPLVLRVLADMFNILGSTQSSQSRNGFNCSSVEAVNSFRQNAKIPRRPPNSPVNIDWEQPLCC